MKSFDKILPLFFVVLGLGACASGTSQAQTAPLPEAGEVKSPSQATDSASAPAKGLVVPGAASDVSGKGATPATDLKVGPATGSGVSPSGAIKPGSSSAPKSNHVAGELLVRFRDDVPESEMSVEKRHAAYLLDAEKKIYATEAERIGTGRLFRLVLPRDFDIARAMKILMATKKFKYVEKNQKFHTMQGGAIGI